MTLHQQAFCSSADDCDSNTTQSRLITMLEQSDYGVVYNPSGEFTTTIQSGKAMEYVAAMVGLYSDLLVALITDLQDDEPLRRRLSEDKHMSKRISRLTEILRRYKSATKSVPNIKSL